MLGNFKCILPSNGKFKNLPSTSCTNFGKSLFKVKKKFEY